MTIHGDFHGADRPPEPTGWFTYVRAILGLPTAIATLAIAGADGVDLHGRWLVAGADWIIRRTGQGGGQ